MALRRLRGWRVFGTFGPMLSLNLDSGRTDFADAAAVGALAAEWARLSPACGQLRQSTGLPLS